MQIEKSLPEGKRIMPDTRFTEFPALPVDPRVGISRSASETDDGLFFLPTRGYQKVLSLTWKEPEIWIYSALFFNVVPFQLHTLVPSSFPVINTRSVEVNILVP